MTRARGPRSEALQEAWDRFWFTEASPLGLAMFRIAFAFCLLREVETSRARSLGALAEGFHWPYASFVPRFSQPVYDLLHTAQYPLILLLGIGLATRASCAGLLLLQGSIFFADRLHFRNHPWFFLIILALLLPAPCGEALSIRTRLGRRRGGRTGARRPLTWQRLIQVQVSIVYVFAALHKLHPDYLRGDVLRDRIEAFHAAGAQGGWIHLPPLLPALAALTVLVELALPLALWFRGSRAWAIAVGVIFHGAIAAVMGTGAFSLSIVASYILFFEPDDLAETFAPGGTTPSVRVAASRRVTR